MSTANAEVSLDDTHDATGGFDRRARLHDTIESLVRLRQQVLLSYGRLAGISAFDRRDQETYQTAPDELRNFCQIMVDYTAMGHFEIYQRIIEGKERRRAVKEAAAEVYPAIAETTDYLVDFNDKYDSFDGSSDEVEMLSGDLSRLGEILAVRSELEDTILSSLRQ